VRHLSHTPASTLRAIDDGRGEGAGAGELVWTGGGDDEAGGIGERLNALERQRSPTMDAYASIIGRSQGGGGGGAKMSARDLTGRDGGAGVSFADEHPRHAAGGAQTAPHHPYHHHHRPGSPVSDDGVGGDAPPVRLLSPASSSGDSDAERGARSRRCLAAPRPDRPGPTRDTRAPPQQLQQRAATEAAPRTATASASAAAAAGAGGGQSGRALHGRGAVPPSLAPSRAPAAAALPRGVTASGAVAAAAAAAVTVPSPEFNAGGVRLSAIMLALAGSGGGDEAPSSPAVRVAAAGALGNFGFAGLVAAVTSAVAAAAAAATASASARSGGGGGGGSSFDGGTAPPAAVFDIFAAAQAHARGGAWHPGDAGAPAVTAAAAAGGACFSLDIVVPPTAAWVHSLRPVLPGRVAAAAHGAAGGGAKRVDGTARRHNSGDAHLRNHHRHHHAGAVAVPAALVALRARVASLRPVARNALAVPLDALLAAAADDADAGVRAAALRALGCLGAGVVAASSGHSSSGSGATGVLVRALGERLPAVRIAAAAALAAWGPSAAAAGAAPLAAAVRAGGVPRHMGCRALARLGGDGARALCGLAGDAAAPPAARVPALEALGTSAAVGGGAGMAADDAAACVVCAVGDASALVRVAAIGAVAALCGRVGDSVRRAHRVGCCVYFAVGVLLLRPLPCRAVSLFLMCHTAAISESIAAAARVCPSHVITTCIPCAQSPLLRQRAVMSLFYHTLADPSPAVRAAAAAALARSGPVGGLLLTEGLQRDAAPHVRAACAGGIAAAGPVAARSLLVALQDEAAEVCARACAGGVEFSHVLVHFRVISCFCLHLRCAFYWHFFARQRSFEC
jgi:hypothetical protein